MRNINLLFSWHENRYWVKCVYVNNENNINIVLLSTDTRIIEKNFFSEIKASNSNHNYFASSHILNYNSILIIFYDNIIFGRYCTRKKFQMRQIYISLIQSFKTRIFSNITYFTRTFDSTHLRQIIHLNKIITKWFIIQDNARALEILNSQVMTVNERSVDGGPCPPRRVLLLWRRDARGLAPRGAVTAASMGHRRRDAIPGASSPTLMLAVSASSLRPSRDKRWATGGQLPSLIRRRSPVADVVGVVRPVFRTDRRRDVCRGPDAVDTFPPSPSPPSRNPAGGTRASRRHTCGEDDVAGRVASRRRTRRPSGRNGVPTPDVRHQPAHLYLLCPGVFGIGW